MLIAPIAISQRGYVFLGLGDILLPAAYLSLLLQYDALRAQVDPSCAITKAFPKPYFWTGIVGYAIGLVLSKCALYYFRTGQVRYTVYIYIYIYVCGVYFSCYLNIH
jgi:hypothetical protein